MTDKAIKQAAIEFIRLPENQNNITISKLQRALKIGYSQAALILEEMEDEGVISHPDVGFRRNLITAEKDT